VQVYSDMVLSVRSNVPSKCVIIAFMLFSTLPPIDIHFSQIRFYQYLYNWNYITQIYHFLSFYVFFFSKQHGKTRERKQ